MELIFYGFILSFEGALFFIDFVNFKLNLLYDIASVLKWYQFFLHDTYVFFYRGKFLVLYKLYLDLLLGFGPRLLLRDRIPDLVFNIAEGDRLIQARYHWDRKVTTRALQVTTLS